MNLSQSLVLLALAANTVSAAAAVSGSDKPQVAETEISQELNLAFHEDPILGSTRAATSRWSPDEEQD